MKTMTGLRRTTRRWTNQPAAQDIQENLARRCWPGQRVSQSNKKAWKSA